MGVMEKMEATFLRGSLGALRLLGVSREFGYFSCFLFKRLLENSLSLRLFTGIPI